MTPETNCFAIETENSNAATLEYIFRKGKWNRSKNNLKG